MKPIIALALVLMFGAVIQAVNPAVPSGHPRVYMRPADIPVIQAKILLPEFTVWWDAVIDGQSEAAVDGGALCNALVYLINNDTTAGRQAVDDASIQEDTICGRNAVASMFGKRR